MKKVNILGTEYTIITATKEEKPKLENSDGYMDCTIKEIVIEDFVADETSIDNLEEYKKEVLRHEIIHAYLKESGLWCNCNPVDSWGSSEEITDWMAMQFPKIYKTFMEVGVV